VSGLAAAVLALHAVYALIWAGLFLVAIGHDPAFAIGVFCWIVAWSIAQAIVITALMSACLRVREALR
jgi:hypothetical protein